MQNIVQALTITQSHNEPDVTLDYIQAFILAILQGLTEFLPISSSAHLILLPKLLGWQDQGLAFDVAVHVGTLLAVIAYLRPQLLAIMRGWINGWFGMKWNADGQLGWGIMLATIPIGLVGLLAENWIESSLRSPSVIALSTAVFAVLLWLSDRTAKHNQKNLTNLGLVAALFAGIAQVFALIPGASRSGVTMTALLALGYQRQDAARFSFLMAIPAILLPGLLKSIELANAPEPVAWSVILLGVTVSAFVAFWCIRWFMALVQNIGMLPFVIYRLLLAVVIWWALV